MKALSQFTDNELRMIVDLLDQCSDHLGSEGCSDSWLPNTDENWELIQKMQRWNSNNPEEWDEREDITDEKRGLFVFNSTPPAYFADKIRKLLSDDYDDPNRIYFFDTAGAVQDDFIKNGVTGGEVQYWMTSCKVTIPQLAKYMNVVPEEIEKARENGLPGKTCLTWMDAIIKTGLDQENK